MGWPVVYYVQDSVLKIFEPDGSPAGTGFVLGPQLGVTCAHVVRAAGATAGQVVGLAWFGEPQTKCSARVLEVGWSNEDDLAFLSWEGDLGQAVAAPLADGPAQPGRPVATVGYPAGALYGEQWMQGSLAGTVSGGCIWQFDGGQLERGLSGAPLLDVLSGRVIGMVFEGQDRERQRLGFARATRVLKEHWPELNLLPLPETSEILQDWIEQTFKLLALRNLGAVSEQALCPLGQVPIGQVRPVWLKTDQGRYWPLPQSTSEWALQVQGVEDEQLYLYTFLLNEAYAEWNQNYLALAGHLTPALRMTDRNDDHIGASGLPLNDLRDALFRHSKQRLVILGDPGGGKTTTDRKSVV